jgi:hypothetical protein
MNDDSPLTASEASQRPRSPRVPVEFALQVEGTDVKGTPFTGGKRPKSAVVVQRLSLMPR